VCRTVPSWGRLRSLGDVIKFKWSSPTFSKVMRITAIQPGNSDDPDYEVTLIEDQFATGARVSGEPVGTGHVDPGAGLDVAPPSASWDEALLPPDGLTVEIVETNSGQFQAVIRGAIIFGFYAPGGQFARVYVTEPSGAQALSPLYLAPDANNKDEFTWPASGEGTYEFCIQTFSLRLATNAVKICASIEVGAITGDSGSGSFVIPQVQLSGTGSVSVGGSGGFNIP